MTYQGGKGAAGVVHQIINRMPRHRVYIETHLGAGRVLMAKKPARRNIAIEIDPDVADRFRYRIASNREDIEYHVGDAVAFLETYPFAGDELVYVDPPYLFDTRRSQRPIYRHEYDQADHVRLLELLDTLPCFVMISGYESGLYRQHLRLPKWRLHTFRAMTRRGVRTEALWCNFDPDAHIKHDYSRMGANFRERERLKRKADRWIANLTKLPPDERNLILSRITDRFGLELSSHL